MAEFLFHKGSPTYLQPENADVMNMSQFMAQNLRQAPPPLPPPPPKHTFEISEGESVEIEKIVAAEKKDGQLFYKVKWVKYTWEAEESIQHLPHLIDGYWREHFYQNINQAVIDTTGITNVANTTETDYGRNKSVVVNPNDNRDVQKAVAAAVQQQQQQVQQQGQQQVDKITVTGDQTTVVNGTVLSAVAAGNVGEHNDVILEFSMPQNKVDHAYQNRLQAVAVGAQPLGDKKPRRSYPLERKYLCTVCQKAFDRNTSLTRHMLVHTREKPFKCQLCDKAFSQNAHLKRHILIHIGQKSYQCNKCGKMFIEKGGLARHEATHSTEKPWVCNQCGKAFVLNEYLQRHLFLHTGQKPYQCNECGRLFADGSSWRAHKLTHNKEKKYKCNICQKMLKCKRNFKKHVQAHTEDKDMKHKCDVCEERFPNKKMLREHNRRAKKIHRCKTCKKYLRSRERFLIHQEFHDPASEKYDPNAKLPGEELDVEKLDDYSTELRSDNEDGSTKSDDEDGHKSDFENDDDDIDLDESEESVGGNTTVVVGVGVSRQPDQEILSTILESSKGDVTQQSDQNTGSAVSALTALILKADHSDESVVTSQIQSENSQVIQTLSPNIERAEMPSVPSMNVGPSGDVGMSIQLPSVANHPLPSVANHPLPSVANHPQPFPTVPTAVSMVQIAPKAHLEQLSAPGISTHIDVGGPQISVPLVSGDDGINREKTIRDSHENIITTADRQAQDADVAETIILITQNNDVDMQQL